MGQREGIRLRPPAALAVLPQTALTLLVAGMVATLLVTYAPGFGSGEKDLDPRFSSQRAETLLNRQAAREQGALVTFGRYLKNAARGNFGTSETFSTPVRDLVSQRAGVTARNLAVGLSSGWLLTLILCGAGAAGWPGRRLGSAATAALLCIPAGLIAFGTAALHLPPGIGIGAVIFPRVFRYVDGMLRSSEDRAYVVAARAGGLSELRILFQYTLRAHSGALLALAGVTANLGLGAAIPIEVLCDEPGIGQLAWRAALGRDLDVVIAVTFILAAVTLTANRAAGFVARRMACRYA